MNYTFQNFTGDGYQNVFSFGFAGEDTGYLSTSDIRVYVSGQPVSFYINLSSPNQVVLTTPPANGASGVIRRVMPDTTTYADYSNGNIFNEDTLNNSFRQQLYLTQQILDGYLPDGFYYKQSINMGGNQIKNMGTPTEDYDAATKVYVDSATSSLVTRLDSTLRFPEKVPQMVKSDVRAKSLQGYNDQGNPVPIFSMTDTADLAIKLASTGGGSLVNTERGETLQEFVNKLQAGEYDVLDTTGFYDRVKKSGMFKMVETPGSPKGTAAFVFGSDGNYGAIAVDERGRLQVYSVVDNKLVASQIALPFVEGTGFFNGPFEDKIVTFPSAGQEDDSKSPALLFSYDQDTQRMNVSVVSPFRVGEEGFPLQGFNEQVNRLSNYYDIGYGLNHSFDHFNTTDINQPRWGKLCTILTGTSGDAARKFSATITTGNYVNYEYSSYVLDVNGQNLVPTAAGGNLNRGNVSQWIKFQRLTESTSTTLVMDNIPEVAVRYEPSNNTAEVWIKLPSFSPRPSISVSTMGNPTYIKVDWTDWSTNSLRLDEPTGLVYAMNTFPISAQNYVKSNGGEVLYAPNIVVRVRDALTSSSPYSTRMSQFQEYGFQAQGTLAVNRFATGITLVKNGTGDYTVNGCTLSSIGWKSKVAQFWDPTSGTGDVAILTIVQSVTNSFRFTLRKRAYQSVVNSAVNPPTVTTTEILGDFVNIPDGTWCDFHVVK